jgi:hypothetical protein
LIVNGRLQLGQAFAKAQISRCRRATVTDTHNGVGDFSFGQLRWSPGDIVLGGRRA